MIDVILIGVLLLLIAFALYSALRRGASCPTCCSRGSSCTSSDPNVKPGSCCAATGKTECHCNRHPQEPTSSCGSKREHNPS